MKSKFLVFLLILFSAIMIFAGCMNNNDNTENNQNETQVQEIDPKNILAHDFFGTWYGDYGEKLYINEEINAVYTDFTGTCSCLWAWADCEFELIIPDGYSYICKNYKGTGILECKNETTNELLLLYKFKPEVSEKHNPDKVEKTIEFEPVFAVLNNEYSVNITKAELFYDKYDQKSIRVYFDVTNNSGSEGNLSKYLVPRIIAGDSTYGICETYKISYNSNEYWANYIFSNSAYLFRKTSVGNGRSIVASAEFHVDWDSAKTVTFQIKHYALTLAESAGAAENLDPSKTYVVEVTLNLK